MIDLKYESETDTIELGQIMINGRVIILLLLSKIFSYSNLKTMFNSLKEHFKSGWSCKKYPLSY